MKLLELFSSYYPFTLTHSKDDEGDEVFTARFTDADGKEVTVETLIFVFLDPVTSDDVHIATVNFERDGHENLSGDGREVSKIFGTVIKAIEQALNKTHFDVLIFGGDVTHGGRVKLYKHLADRFAEKYGLKQTAPEWLIKALGNHIDGKSKPFFLSK